jgi:hypothetical protein
MNHEPITNNQINTKSLRSKSDYADLIVSVDARIFGEWLKVRKTKKATTTRTAIEKVARQAEIAGLTLDQAIKICVEESWAGFNASWPRTGGNRAIQNRHSAGAAAIFEGASHV